VALDDQRGLVLAEAEAEADKSPLGAGCLNIKGENSPAEPGSPVLDTEGRVVGLVSMRVPQKGWFGFGTSVDAAASLLETRKIAKEQPMGRLAHRRFAKVSDQEPFLDAVRALGEGRHAAAAGQLARLSRAYPRSAEVWAMLGFATSKTGSKEDALNCWRKAVALDPASTRFWHQLAVSQVLSARGGENAAARESLEKAVQGRSADASTWWLLARQQVAEGQFAKAARSLEEVMARHAGYAPALYLLGYVKARLGEPANAETALLRCAKLAPRDAKPRFLLATIFAAQGRMEDAIARLREVVRMDPGHPHAWHHLARLYRKVGREAEARLTFSEFQRVARRSNQIHTTALREQEGGAK
jgi:cytochrome c-type biogenesis protein CcmH/NrfG